MLNIVGEERIDGGRRRETVHRRGGGLEFRPGFRPLENTAVECRRWEIVCAP